MPARRTYRVRLDGSGLPWGACRTSSGTSTSRSALDTINYGVLILDAEMRGRMYNRAFRDLAQIPDDVLRARPTMRDIIESSQRREILGGWQKFARRTRHQGSGQARIAPLNTGLRLNKPTTNPSQQEFCIKPLMKFVGADW